MRVDENSRKTVVAQSAQGPVLPAVDAFEDTLVSAGVEYAGIGRIGRDGCNRGYQQSIAKSLPGRSAVCAFQEDGAGEILRRIVAHDEVYGSRSTCHVGIAGGVRCHSQRLRLAITCQIGG